MKFILLILSMSIWTQAQAQVKIDAKVKREAKQYSFIVDVQNLSSSRVDQYVCARFYDRSGFEIDGLHPFGKLFLAPGASDRVTYSTYMNPKAIEQIKEIKIYIGQPPLGCFNQPGNALSNVEVIKY